jgi:uncharacterized protein YeaO (DUF488 family)
MLKLKRAYESPETGDGKRILIDRLWPRGISKTTAHLDAWIKELAPSNELRKWFGHDDDRWEVFQKRYIQELSSPDKETILDDIADMQKRETVTLVYGAKNPEHNNGVILKQLIEERMKRIAKYHKIGVN